MSKLRDDLYQRINGFKPVKNLKDEWYYNDPRYEDDNPNSKIKVANENSPNPKIDEILRDDMNNNPEDYYIWRTQEDDKVRSTHADRERRIFNRQVPPEGGNPGEDYNCRCWAEPYHIKKHEQPDTAKVDLSGLPQYKTSNISDDELLEKMWNNIKEFEAVIDYPYLDSKGYITTGAGANINNINDFMKVDFVVNAVLATDSQKLEAYYKLKEMSQEKDINGNYLYANNKAYLFKDKTNLRLSEQDAYNMARQHMKNDLAHVRKEFTDFDNFPNQLKEVLLDIQYNTGNLNEKNWPKLYEAIRNKDVEAIANNVHRKDIGWDRNDWAERTISSIRF